MSAWHSLGGQAAAGTLYGIGVGPGDVRYLTLRAAALVETVDLVAYFAKRGRAGNARTVVAPLLAAGRAELRLEYPVTDEIPVTDPAYGRQMSAFYAEAAGRLAHEIGQGRSVGLLAEGDPFFYGSFMHMWRRLADTVPTEVVPGVTGMSGCWTRANAPITWGDDVLTVLPGTLGEAQLAERLQATDAAVIMKIGKNFAKVRRAVTSAGKIDRAIYVERGTMAAERIIPLAEAEDKTATYFAMVLVPGRGRRL